MRSRLLQHCRPTQMSLARWPLLSVNAATCSEESCLAICEDARAALHQTFTCTHVQLSSCYLLQSVWLALTTAECAVQYRAWQQSGHFFIQMDLAEHGNLGHLLRQVCLCPSSMTRATEASATRCQLCSSMRSSRNRLLLLHLHAVHRNAHVQAQEEGLLLPDALVWQVLWEVAQVRPIEEEESLHLFQPTQG